MLSLSAAHGSTIITRISVLPTRPVCDCLSSQVIPWTLYRCLCFPVVRLPSGFLFSFITTVAIAVNTVLLIISRLLTLLLLLLTPARPFLLLPSLTLLLKSLRLLIPQWARLDPLKVKWKTTVYWVSCICEPEDQGTCGSSSLTSGFPFQIWILTKMDYLSAGLMCLEGKSLVGL